MRQCKKCDTELILGKNITQSRLKNSDYKCKECKGSEHKKWVKDNKESYKEYQKQYSAQNYQDTKDGGYVVYLTKDNYAGVTQHTQLRLSNHCSKRGYTGKYLCVLHQTDCKYEATELEDLLHDMGYKGRHKQNMPYWAMT